MSTWKELKKDCNVFYFNSIALLKNRSFFYSLPLINTTSYVIFVVVSFDKENNNNRNKNNNNNNNNNKQRNTDIKRTSPSKSVQLHE